MRGNSAQRIRLAMDAFISALLCCVNKRKEPPRAAAPIGVTNIVGFSCRYADSGGTNGLPDLVGSVRLTTENGWVPLGGKYCRIFLTRRFRRGTGDWAGNFTPICDGVFARESR